MAPVLPPIKILPKKPYKPPKASKVPNKTMFLRTKLKAS